MVRLVKTVAVALVVAAVLGAWTAPAAAVSMTFEGSSGSRSASVTFELVSQPSYAELYVTLTNMSGVDAQVPTDILTAVFFNIRGNPVLNPLSASLAGSSSVLFVTPGTPQAGPDVGSEWAYRSGLSGAPHGASYGISSVGLDLFGPGDRFTTNTNLQGPDSPDGLQYGLATAGDNPLTGNTLVTGEYALIRNSVVLEFGAVAPGGTPPFALTDITNVVFQYGTGLGDPHVPSPVPEPGTLVLVGAGMAALGVLGRKRLSGKDTRK